MNQNVQYSAAAAKRANYSESDLAGSELIRTTGDNFVELKYRSTQNYSTAAMAKGLGFFSLAIGLAEVLMPSQLGELAGLSRKQRAGLPVLGLRELAHGIGILSSAKPTTAVWTRVAGDVLDLAYLGPSFVSDDGNKKRLAVATAAVLGVAALDLIAAQRLSSQNWREGTNPLAPTTLGQSSGRQQFSDQHGQAY